MRTTQFIGLTRAADNFIKSIKQVVDAGCRNTYGMFGEYVPLRSWLGSDPVEGRITRYNEVVQARPWSSGMMIFTCLESEGGRLFEWIEDSSVIGEVDYENGKFWV